MSTPIDVGGAAFPCYPIGQRGMTLRDWFAGQALAGTLANAEITRAIAKASSDYLEIHEKMAESAYGSADAMIAERSKSSEKS